MSGDPILELWPYMSIGLQTRLLGVHQKHKKLSVKKVIGSLRGGSLVIARTLRTIGEYSKLPTKSDSSTPVLESAAAGVLTTRLTMKCSQYVKHTCEVLLEKCKATDMQTSANKLLSCEDFFLTLIGAGPSPLLLEWQEDGFDAARIREIFEESKAELEREKRMDKGIPQSHVHGAIEPSPSVNEHEKWMNEELSNLHVCGAVESLPSVNPHERDLIDLTHAGLSPDKEDCDVFISYGRDQNTTSLVIRLKRDLEREGFKVWLDITDISGGSHWHSAIGEGLRKCKALIAIVTQKYIHSKYCKNELFMADTLHKHIFPIFLEEVRFDSSDDAGVQYVIASINWIIMTPAKSTYSKAFSQLLHGMYKKGLTSSNAVSSVSTSHSSSETSTKTQHTQSDDSSSSSKTHILSS